MFITEDEWNAEFAFPKNHDSEWNHPTPDNPVAMTFGGVWMLDDGQW